MAKKEQEVDAGAAAPEVAAAAAPAAKEAPPAKAELIRLRLPEGVSGVSYQGVALEVKGGVVATTSHRVAEHLIEAFGAADVSHA